MAWIGERHSDVELFLEPDRDRSHRPCAVDVSDLDVADLPRLLRLGADLQRAIWEAGHSLRGGR